MNCSLRFSPPDSESETQASISVLLVLGYGALAAQYKFMSIEGEKVRPSQLSV